MILIVLKKNYIHKKEACFFSLSQYNVGEGRACHQNKLYAQQLFTLRILIKVTVVLRSGGSILIAKCWL